MDSIDLHRHQSNGGNGWGWREGRVDVAEDHFELYYGSGDSEPATWTRVARIGSPVGTVFPVELTTNDVAMVDAAIAEINFYLVEKREPNPWVYAQYHCGTCSNWYSAMHWSFLKGERKAG